MYPRTLFFAGIVICMPLSFFVSQSSAVSPAAIQQGRELFERTWTSNNPEFGSDGLGPLFNARSCVACHHQGGVGGGGDSRFNAQSVGIERIEFTTIPADAATRAATTVANKIRNQRRAAGLRPNVASPDRRARLLRSFYPGFFQAGSIINSAALPHHGGTYDYSSLRNRVLAHANVMRSEEGGPVDAAEVRRSVNTPILFHNTLERETITVKATLFQRNTTSLFGAGLIDAIPESEIKTQIQLQTRHPEISGRPSILRDGSFGRFGWRANSNSLVSFVDRACANELSLETERRPQMIDPGRPSYRNPAIDITDTQIENMSDFIAALPRPIERMPEDPSRVAQVNRGRQAFEAVGCAICHTPNLGNVAGLYSDLLLHDMGSNLYDYDAAEPYVIGQKISQEPREIAGTAVVGYYGQSTAIGSSLGIPDIFQSPRASTATSDYVTIEAGNSLGRHQTEQLAGGFARTAEFREEIGFRRKLKPSNTSQEWRTPPLWGVRDTAPYMHDGRAETLLESIAMHDGESAGTRDRFLNLPLADRHAVIAFLETLVAPPDAPQPAL